MSIFINCCVAMSDLRVTTPLKHQMNWSVEVVTVNQSLWSPHCNKGFYCKPPLSPPLYPSVLLPYRLILISCRIKPPFKGLNTTRPGRIHHHEPPPMTVTGIKMAVLGKSGRGPCRLSVPAATAGCWGGDGVNRQGGRGDIMLLGSVQQT